ncbi:anti-sigma B factor RsbW [Cytobacillus sp. S13-E01]|uniref:anti-sigma B factor RsbW n=1 Tax=Cytobacillus sp. S13-E01 TaxID=3031326 RepID=UPI0023D89FCE|nr:anti-sigma B factor RsbW [Cytobacillus sp. S13-E01]MDF0727674.1 anti-sigma B factor RsbW [Cytobacillus sp. S13-E01]
MNQLFDYIEMKVPAKPEYVGVVRLTLSGVASRMGYVYEDIEDLKIATSEACTNAVQHAYEMNEGGEITIGYGLYHDRLEVMVADNGQSFNVEKTKEEIGPYSTDNSEEDDLQEGGLGLYLIDTLMDDVKVFNHYGVTIFMTKYLQKEKVENDDTTTISTSQSK